MDSVIGLYREKIAGDILSQDNGLLLTFEDVVVTLFGWEDAQDPGELTVKSCIDVYKNVMLVVPMRC